MIGKNIIRRFVQLDDPATTFIMPVIQPDNIDIIAMGRKKTRLEERIIQVNMDVPRNIIARSL